MGQLVTGILYGTKHPKDVAILDDEEDDGGLLDAFDCSLNERIGWSRDRVRVWTDEAFKLVGAWAVEVMTHHDPTLPSVDLLNTAAFTAALAGSERGKEAVRLWSEFAEFARRRGVDLGTPTWWIATHEVA
jgi:hypothetical protein